MIKLWLKVNNILVKRLWIKQNQKFLSKLKLPTTMFSFSPLVWFCLQSKQVFNFTQNNLCETFSQGWDLQTTLLCILETNTSDVIFVWLLLNLLSNSRSAVDWTQNVLLWMVWIMRDNQSELGFVVHLHGALRHCCCWAISCHVSFPPSSSIFFFF